MAEEYVALIFSHQHIKKKKQQPSTCRTIHTENLLSAGRELKPPQRARNPPHNWIEQKKKGEREGEKRHQDETSILETEPRKRKGTHSLGSYLANRDQPRWRDHKIAEKSAAAGLRRAKQNESHTDHLHHRLGHHSLRHLVGVGCWDSPRRPQMRKARRMCGLIGEVRCRCWGRQEGEGWSAIGISFPVHMQILRGWGAPGEAPFAWDMSDWVPLVWVMGCRGLSKNKCLLWGLQVVGTNHGSHLREQRGHGSPPVGVSEQAPTVAPVTSEATKEEGTTTEHHLLLLSQPWEHIRSAAATATAKCSGHQLHMPDHCPFPGACN